MIQKLADIALAEVGVQEVGGNNLGPRIAEYQAATWLPPGPWPWCAAFVDWCVREWLNQHVTVKAEFLRGVSKAEWRPQTAGAFDLERWATQRRLPIFTPSAEINVGDIVVYDMSHCGIAVANSYAGSIWIYTVEGNTGPEGLRDSTRGDGVWRKKRSRKLVRSIIRLVP